jgi:hypothetical protein
MKTQNLFPDAVCNFTEVLVDTKTTNLLVGEKREVS